MLGRSLRLSVCTQSPNVRFDTVPSTDRIKALEKGESLKDIKRLYQKHYGINARQFNSVYASIKGKIASRLKSYANQLDQLEDAIKGISKAIQSRRKKLKKASLSCAIGATKSYRKLLDYEIHQKQRRLFALKARLAKLKAKKPSLIFGSKNCGHLSSI